MNILLGEGDFFSLNGITQKVTELCWYIRGGDHISALSMTWRVAFRAKAYDNESTKLGKVVQSKPIKFLIKFIL